MRPLLVDVHTAFVNLAWSCLFVFKNFLSAFSSAMRHTKLTKNDRHQSLTSHWHHQPQCSSSSSSSASGDSEVVYSIRHASSAPPAIRRMYIQCPLIIADNISRRPRSHRINNVNRPRHCIRHLCGIFQSTETYSDTGPTEAEKYTSRCNVSSLYR